MEDPYRLCHSRICVDNSGDTSKYTLFLRYFLNYYKIFSILHQYKTRNTSKWTDFIEKSQKLHDCLYINYVFIVRRYMMGLNLLCYSRTIERFVWFVSILTLLLAFTRLLPVFLCIDSCFYSIFSFLVYKRMRAVLLSTSRVYFTINLV